jgi:PadR family transcriptional regulator AphA
MASNSVSSRHFILGLLAQQPMTGYDIKRVLKRLSWLVGSLSFGSLYPALHALKEDGLVTVDVDAQEDRPSRKIYSLTQSGRQALEEWVNQPTRSNPSMKAFVMRLMLADNFSQAGLITQLHQRRAQVATQRAALEQRGAAPDYKVNLGRRLALDYGLALADTELDWLDSVLDRLFEEPLPMEGVQGG